MPAKRPSETQALAEPTPEEARAARLARLEGHRNRRPRHSASSPLTYDLSNFPPCGPSGGYTIVNVPAGDDVEVTRVQA